MKIWKLALVVAVSFAVVCPGNSAAQTVSSAPGGNSIIEINGVFVGVNPLTVTPQSVTPQSVTPPSVTPPSVIPPSVTPPSVTPPSVTPQSVTPQSVTPATVTPASVTPASVTPTVLGSSTAPAMPVPGALVITPQNIAPAITPPLNTTTAFGQQSPGIGIKIGQQGSGTAIGQQGSGTAIGQQGSGTAIGQQGFATSMAAPNNVPANNAVVIGQPEPFSPPPPVTTPSVIGFSPSLSTAVRPGLPNVNAQAGFKAVTPRTSVTPGTPSAPPSHPPSGRH